MRRTSGALSFRGNTRAQYSKSDDSNFPDISAQLVCGHLATSKMLGFRTLNARTMVSLMLIGLSCTRGTQKMRVENHTASGIIHRFLVIVAPFVIYWEREEGTSAIEVCTASGVVVVSITDSGTGTTW
jgi:hypothetical protein